MFQTEIIHAVQSISFEWLTKFITLIDLTGTHQFITTVLIIIIFGISFKKGVFIAQTVIWTHLFTGILKDYFALPRPIDVDSNIKLLDSGIVNEAPFKNMGAQTFLGKLPDEVVSHYRNVKHYSYGFPSGHTSGAAALWGSVSISFKEKWLHTIAITLIFLVAFARLYLGKHFFIDILGGFVLGILIISLNYFIFSNGTPKKIKLCIHRNFNTFLYIAYMIVIPLLVLWLTKSKFAAQILGLNFGFILISINQIPLDSGSILKRILRVSVAIVIFSAINYLISNLYEISFAKETRILQLSKHTITYFFMIWGTTKILFFAGLFKKSHSRNYYFN